MRDATVFIVDDDQAARESVAALVRPMAVRVELFAAAEDFLASYDPVQRGCLVTDLRMGGMSGTDLQAELQRRKIRIPIILISAYADVPIAVRAIQSGAVTVLEKPCRGMELWDAIRDALDRDEKDRHLAAQAAEYSQRLASLAAAEHAVLKLIVDGLTNRQIADELGVSLRTVEARRHNIMKKMGVASVAQLVQATVLARSGT